MIPDRCLFRAATPLMVHIICAGNNHPFQHRLGETKRQETAAGGARAWGWKQDAVCTGGCLRDLSAVQGAGEDRYCFDALDV